MCGIIGAFGPSVQSLKNQYQIALKSILHRGPDSKGAWFSDDGFCFLGHQRLAILDSSSFASQPMEDNEGVLVYNGEIYNHLALRNELFPEKFPDFKTHSDTETLFYFLKKFPRKDVLTRLNGMFAGAYYQKESNSLFLFRDALGIKPLYWHAMEDGTVLFSSEIKGIFALFPHYSRQLDQSVLENYLMFENWPQGHSLFAGIRLLLPGESLLLKADDNIGVSRKLEIWSPLKHEAKKEFNLFHKTSLPTDYDGWVSYVRNAVEETVKSHLLSDVPVSAYLSGGLDSGTIVAIAAQNHKDLLTFTGYYDVEDSWYDERIVAQKTAECYKIQQVEIPITPDDFIHSFDDLIQVLEEPRMGMGSFSQLTVAKQASKHRRVILAGHGGDELFLGYPLFKACTALKQFPQISSWKVLASLHRKEWPWFLNLLFGVLSGKIYLAPRLWANFPFERLAKKKQSFPEFLAPSLPKLLEALETYYVDTYLPGLLMVEDKISMSYSLETRTPFWSPTFLSRIQNIPAEVRLSKGRLKGLFKDAVSCWLPPEVINAPKRGFPTPFRYWFRKELREEIERRLLKEGDVLDSLVSKKQRKELLRSHFNTKLPFALDEKRAHKIWMLLCLESWARQFHIQWKFS